MDSFVESSSLGLIQTESQDSSHWFHGLKPSCKVRFLNSNIVPLRRRTVRWDKFLVELNPALQVPGCPPRGYPERRNIGPSPLPNLWVLMRVGASDGQTSRLRTKQKDTRRSSNSGRKAALSEPNCAD